MSAEGEIYFENHAFNYGEFCRLVAENIALTAQVADLEDQLAALQP